MLLRNDKFQLELRQSRAKLTQERLGFVSVLHSDNEVVGVADDNNVAARPLPAALQPQVEGVVGGRRSPAAG